MRPSLRLREQRKTSPTVAPCWRDMDSCAYRCPWPVFSPLQRQQQKSSQKGLFFGPVGRSSLWSCPRHLLAMLRSPHHKQIP
jgi:hypothetical protein